MFRAFVIAVVLAGCATPGPQHVAQVPTRELSPNEACDKLTKSVEAHAAAMQAAIAAERPSLDPLVEVQRTACRGNTLVAELYLRATVDEAVQEATMVIRVTLRPDGVIEGEVLGAKRVE